MQRTSLHRVLLCLLQGVHQLPKPANLVDQVTVRWHAQNGQASRAGLPVGHP